MAFLACWALLSQKTVRNSKINVTVLKVLTERNPIKKIQSKFDEKFYFTFKNWCFGPLGLLYFENGLEMEKTVGIYLLALIKRMK